MKQKKTYLGLETHMRLEPLYPARPTLPLFVPGRLW
jgi:hypothetical protein